MSKTESPISINEHLSAMLDDQVGAFEQRRILDELKTDLNLSRKLSSYALIGEIMRTGDSEKPLLISGRSFLDGVHDKIELEDNFDEVVVATADDSNQSAETIPVKSQASWFRPFGGFAVAASLGAIAFMGLQNMGLMNNPSGILNNSAPTPIVQINPVESSIENKVASNEKLNSANDEQYIEADSQTRSLLKRYVDTHMQYATSTAFVPSVRVIAYADNQ